jgi:hypothetical protein
MFHIHAMSADEVPCFIADQCRNLCNNGSESQGMFDRISLMSLKPEDHLSSVSYAWVDGGDDGPQVIGWCSVTPWSVGDEEKIAIQGYVDSRYRQRGIATSLAISLTHDMPRDPLPVAVFSPEFFRIAQHLGWNADEYMLVDDGWVGVNATNGRHIGTEADEE